MTLSDPNKKSPENFGQRMKRFALDSLFPINCLICGKSDVWICFDCENKINFLPSQVCPYCEKAVTPSGSACQRCKNKLFYKNISFPLDALVSSAKYGESGLSKAIHLYKYNFISDLSEILGRIVTKALIRNNCTLPDAIIPVPLHRRRLHWRGFNQSELLAEYISLNLAPGMAIPVFSDLLSRKHHTKPQMKIKNYAERQKNIKGAFEIKSADCLPLFKDKNILLIDDICTTGATLFECGKILKQNGAKAVFGAVIARQEISA